MTSAGRRGPFARSEYVPAPDHPPVESETPCRRNAQRLTLGSERRRLDEDAEMALAAGGAVDECFDPIAGTIGGDDHHPAAPSPAVTVLADRFRQAPDAVVGGEGEEIEEPEALHLAAPRPEARTGARVRDESDGLTPSDRTVHHRR